MSEPSGYEQRLLARIREVEKELDDTPMWRFLKRESLWKEIAGLHSTLRTARIAREVIDTAA